MAYFPKYIWHIFELAENPKLLEILTKLEMSKLEETFSISEVSKYVFYVWPGCVTLYRSRKSLIGGKMSK